MLTEKPEIWLVSSGNLNALDEEFQGSEKALLAALKSLKRRFAGLEHQR